MASRTVIDEFLSQEHVAFVGVSRNSKHFANVVYRSLREHGHTLYPVNPAADGAPLEGDPSFRRIGDVPEPLDGVLVMVPADDAAEVVREALERGAPRIWLHRGTGKGSVSDEAVRLCRDAGVPVVDGACPLMFEEPVKGIHRMHRLLVGHRFAA
jgi:uncharacterized protein